MEKYLRKYVGEVVEVEASKKLIYTGSVLPDEYTSSKYTRSLKGARLKAKAISTYNKLIIEGYSVYSGCLVAQVHANNRLYLYDLVNIKKETSNPLQIINNQMVQNPFL